MNIRLCSPRGQARNPGPRPRRTGASTRCASLLMACLLAAAPLAKGQDSYQNQSLAGDYVVSLQGSFKASPPPPLPPDVLRLDAVLIGRYTLDGFGQVEGEHFVTFSNAAVPFNPRSAFEVSGNYSVSPEGHIVMWLEEDKVENGGGDGQKDGDFVVECYIVERRLFARCALHSLVSYGPGPVPDLQPATMAGTLERQH